LAVVCVLVIGAYAYMAQSPTWEPVADATETYYNLLVRGFRAGQLNLKKEVPVGLTQLADPYDPYANGVYRAPPYWMHDLSYYKGKVYLYWGVTPVVLLFWPYVALTGRYLFHKQAVAVFCALGFLASVGLLRDLWRRYFAEVNIAVVLACALALGFVTGVPVLLSWAGVYEVPISCGYMLTMLALGAIWRALHEPERRCRWLALASVAYGLAVGSRPTLLFGAVILLVPVAEAWREQLVSGSSHERRQVWRMLLAAMGPILFIGLGLMLYNNLRFGSPFQFGQDYQMSGERQVGRQFFKLHYLWFNFRVYFLEPARWSVHSPFIHGDVVSPLPSGYAIVGEPYGILTNIPVVWLALGAPLAWRNRPGQTGTALRWFVMAVAILFGICALTLMLYESAIFRYKVDFLPALVWLAVIGILGVERSLANRPQIWRNVARSGWGALLAFSVAFNLLATVGYYADGQNGLGVRLYREGKVSEAIEHYLWSLRLQPHSAEAHSNLGAALEDSGNHADAIAHYEAALRIKPDDAEAQNNLGTALWHEGKRSEAIGRFQAAVRIKSDYAMAQYNWGKALVQMGNAPEAIGHFTEAVRIDPDYFDAHYDLGTALAQTGKAPEAIAEYEQALRIRPDTADVHNDLAVALAVVGKVPEAIEQYEQALRIKPDYAVAHYNLGGVLVQLGRVQEAIQHWEEAVRNKPDYAEAHHNLATALAQTGKVPEAIAEYELTLRLNPGDTQASNALARLQSPQ